MIVPQPSQSSGGGRLRVSPPGPGFKWYSMCSKHRDYRTDCRFCRSGDWRFEPTAKLSRLFFRMAPGVWRRWANR